MIKSQYLTVVGSSTLSFPSNGFGGVSTIRGSKSSSNTTFTSTTVVDASAWTLTTVAVGDYAVADTGEWGVVQSKGTNTITVDKWRKATTGNVGAATKTPAATTPVGVYGPNVLAGNYDIGIGGISILKCAANDTVAITDSAGTAIAGLTITAPSAAPIDFYFGEPSEGGGIWLNQPFGVKCNTTTSVVVVRFTALH